MEIILGYFAGLLTLINPCVLPVLPIALASAVQGDKHGPAWLALGMSITFVIIGVGISAIGPAIGLNVDQIASAGALLMIAFGAILLVPAFSNKFTAAMEGVSANADVAMTNMDANGASSQIIAGGLLGLVWSPCIGPTLGGAISLASQGQSLIWAAAIMAAYAAGISTIIIALGYGARETIRARQASMRAIAEKAKPIMGFVFIGVGLMIFFQWHKVVEGTLLDLMPYWLQDLSVLI